MFFIFKLKTEEVAIRLKQARDSKNLSTAEVAKNTGLSSGNISSWENGKFLPSATALALLSDQYNVSVDWILKGVESKSDELPQTQKVEAIFDPDLKRMIDVLKDLMESEDTRRRTWAIIQFEDAFKQQCATHDEKKLHA